MSSIRALETEMLLCSHSQSLLLRPRFLCHPRFTNCSRIRGNRRRTRVVSHAQYSVVHEIAQIAEELALDGPIELPSEIEQQPTSPLQIVGSVILTGAIVVLLLRSLKRRLKDAKEKKPLKEQAKQVIADLANQQVEIERPPPSIPDTIFGALLAGGIAFVLYQVSTAVDASFVNKTLPNDYAARNIAITVRTIISGLCYLATCVYAANAVGLTLYGIQLFIDPPPQPAEKKEPLNSEEPPK